MLAIDLIFGEAFIRLCIQVTNPNIKKGEALPLSEATSMNVDQGIRCFVATGCQHFSVYLVKYRFSLDIIAHHL